MGEDCHDIERYRDEQAEYAQTAADSGEEDLLEIEGNLNCSPNLANGSPPARCPRPSYHMSPFLLLQLTLQKTGTAER
jgi:hypothetical protein